MNDPLITVIDVDDYEEAIRDPRVAATLARADALYQKMLDEGRDHSFPKEDS